MIKREDLKLGVVYYFLDKMIMGGYHIRTTVLLDYYDIEDYHSPIKPYNLFYTYDEALACKNRRLDIALEIMYDPQGFRKKDKVFFLELLRKIENNEI